MTPSKGGGPASVVIRSAEADDFETVVVLELEVFGRSAWSPQVVDAEFAELGSSRFIALAESGREVGGYGVLMYVGESADISRIAVRHSNRRRGVATRLLDRLLDEAARRGCERALLEVAADNEAALGLYAAGGFVEIARRPRYYRGDVDAVVMELQLPGSTRSTEEDV